LVVLKGNSCQHYSRRMPSGQLTELAQHVGNILSVDDAVTIDAMLSTGVCALGVQLSCVLVGVVGLANRLAPASGAAFVGDEDGVVCRSGEGDAGDSGRLKGELREGGEP